MSATRVHEPDTTPPAELVIRRMAYADLDEVAAIERRSFSCPWTRDSFRRLIERADADLLVADVGGRVAGYAVVWYSADEAELGNLAVDVDHRRRGIGGRLLDAALGQARRRGAGRIFLEVRVSNQEAEALYRSRGFVLAGMRPRYYRRPVEDAKVMLRNLADSAS